MTFSVLRGLALAHLFDVISYFFHLLLAFLVGLQCSSRSYLAVCCLMHEVLAQMLPLKETLLGHPIHSNSFIR